MTEKTAQINTNPAPSNSSVRLNGVEVYETTITLSTYPVWDYLIEQVDPVYNLPVLYFNRPEFEADAPTPSPKDYQAVVLENPYLRLTFLPELGGRLYSVVIKSTGQELFYHNPVVKPSRYGILQPVEANWWLATGGMEWAYPTQEHGLRWGVPWEYDIVETFEGVAITLSDMAEDRVGVEVTVTLAADSGLFTVTPKLVNNGPETVPVQFWINAVLSLGSATMSPDTEFVLPVEQAIVHSRGAGGWTVPDEYSEVSWPREGRTNLADYGQWTDYLGLFVPDEDLPFMGAYNPDTNLGVVRLPEPGAIEGHKLFAFGPDFMDRSYTDDGSQYFEMWGGVNAGFWPEDDILVEPGESLQWQEHWWPLAELGGLTWANNQVAIAVDSASGEVTLSALFSRPQQGELLISDGENLVLQAPFVADPMEPLRWSIDKIDGPLEIRFVDRSGAVLLEHCSEC